MTKWKLLVGMLFLSAASYVFAGEETETAQLNEKIVKLMASITTKLNPGIHTKFCRHFFEDFQKQEKIVHVRPIVQVSNYDDPALASFKAKCPKFRLANREGDEDPAFELNETTGDQFGNLWQGTAHFRLYKINVKNGDEYVFYFDRVVPKSVDPQDFSAEPETSGEYRMVDFEPCEILDAVTVDMQRQFEKVTKRPGYNGIIQYKKHFYIFDLYPVNGYRLTLWEYTNRQRKFKPICAYK
jgi:hypothetical protein